jgi:hypothetical protein
VKVKWDEGAGKAFSSKSIQTALQAAAAKPGATIKKRRRRGRWIEVSGAPY